MYLILQNMWYDQSVLYKENNILIAITAVILIFIEYFYWVLEYVFYPNECIVWDCMEKHLPFLIIFF